MKFPSFISQRIDAWIIILLLILGAYTRLTDLGTFLTVDEKTWIVRSYEFIRAFKDIRFNDMLQTTHPGVTTLWASGISITAKMVFSQIPFTSNALIAFVKAAQFPIALANTLVIPILYVILKRLFSRPVATLSALFLVLNPLIIGYSRVIHVDALLGSFLTLAVLTVILYARDLERKWLLFCALFSALALLTKIPAIFIVPFLGCTLLLFHFRSFVQRAFITNRIRELTLWGLIICTIILISWPALLFVPNPTGNVLVIKRDVVVAATTPHNMVEEYSLKPLHYLAALLDRSTPVSLIGVCIALVGVCVSLYMRRDIREILAVLIYICGFIAMMTLGAKKGDRYILPVFFALDILAAWGIVWVCGLIKNVQIRSRALRTTFVALPVYLFVVVVSYHPYEVAYANPLFPNNLSEELGWGQGLDQVAKWLNDNYPNAGVASWYPEELGAFTSARVLHINAHQQNQVRFVVLYRNMFGREPSHYANDFIDEYYKKQEPVFVARIRGLEFAWVYEKPSYSNTVGDLVDQVVVVQEVEVLYEGLAGFDILPATRSGNAKTGKISIEVANSLTGPAFFTSEVDVSALKDTQWFTLRFPASSVPRKGDHLFMRIRGRGITAPYASIRYSSNIFRSTPFYISRTGSVADAEEKPGSLGVRMVYIGTDGKEAVEYQTKLLRQ